MEGADKLVRFSISTSAHGHPRGASERARDHELETRTTFGLRHLTPDQAKTTCTEIIDQAYDPNDNAQFREASSCRRAAEWAVSTLATHISTQDAAHLTVPRGYVLNIRREVLDG